jgi:hypothetical protein
MYRNTHRFVPFILALVAVMGATQAHAQATANGPYYATPSWDQKLQCDTPSTCPRFIVLANWNNEAVLDRETGLVWQRSPATDKYALAFSIYVCAATTTGGRQGWRLPRADELMSLGDPANTSTSGPHLPGGHPFFNVSGFDPYWVIDHTPADFPDSAMVVVFNLFGAGASLVNGQPFSSSFLRWCVRGPAGAGTR